MEYINYEKPRMRVVDLRSEQAIAAKDGNCLPKATPGHGASNRFFWDAPGDGWVLIITENNCNGNIINIKYEDNPQIEGTVSKEAQDKAIKDAQNAFTRDKQAFSGAVADSPDPSWS